MKSTSTSPDASTFFELFDPLATRPFRLTTQKESDWLPGKQTWLLHRGELELKEPLKLEACRGGSPSDFLWANFVHFACISARVAQLLTENGITGWSTYPVTIFGRKGNPVPGYSGFSVIGPMVHWDRSRSRIVDKPPPTPRGQGYQAYRGIYFDESQWDGSDFFLLQDFNFTLVTAKVARLFKRERVYNVRLTPLPEVEVDALIVKYATDSRPPG